MTESEKQLLREFAQTRIETHYRRYRSGLDTYEMQAEEELYERLRSRYGDLNEEDRQLIDECDKLRFQRIADKEQLMYYAGFRDGVRAGRLLHEMEEEPLLYDKEV